MQWSPVELSVMMEMVNFYTVQYWTHKPLVTAEYMKCGYYDWATKLLVLFNII